MDRSGRRLLVAAAIIVAGLVASAAVVAGIGAGAFVVVRALREPSVSVPIDSDEVPDCELLDAPLPVSELARHDDHRCNLGGTTVLFPDGATLELARATSGSSSTGDCLPTYSYIDLGTLGYVVNRTTADGRHTRWWGHPRAVTHVTDAFGTRGDTNGDPADCR